MASSTPLLTFKAGRCDLNGRKITPLPTPGYIYLVTGAEDEMLHFCWRPRSAAADNPTLDLLMVPGDGSFRPLVKDDKSPTNGRVFGLRFESSSQKHYFWMQSKSESDDASSFGVRDRHISSWVDAMLQGEEVDVEAEMAELQQNGTGGGGSGGNANGDGDADAMEVDEGQGTGGSGGAGQGSMGGDTRQEGEASREGGADGGRAPTQQAQDPSDLVSNFLASLNNSTSSNTGSAPPSSEPYPTLSDLLSTGTTIPFLATCSEHTLDALCAYLPTDLFHPHTNSHEEPLTPVIPTLSTDQKREILSRVMRSPQLHQSLGSLTVALRDGGLPIVGEALGLKLKHGGTIRGGSVPLGGNEAVEEFVEGVKRTVEGEKK